MKLKRQEWREHAINETDRRLAVAEARCPSVNDEKRGSTTIHVPCILVEGHEGPHFCAAPHRQWT